MVNHVETDDFFCQAQAHRFDLEIVWISTRLDSIKWGDQILNYPSFKLHNSTCDFVTRVHYNWYNISCEFESITGIRLNTDLTRFEVRWTTSTPENDVVAFIMSQSWLCLTTRI